MVARTLHYLSLGCSLLVIVSFTLFALDQVGGASSHQAAQIAPSAPIVTPPPTTQHGQPRRFIDGAAHVLTGPFDGIVPSDDGWVNHGIPSLFAILVFGGGLGFLARFASGRSGGGAGSIETPAFGEPPRYY